MAVTFISIATKAQHVLRLIHLNPNDFLLYRCVFTTVNPETGEKRGDGEPLNTLKR